MVAIQINKCFFGRFAVDDAREQDFIGGCGKAGQLGIDNFIFIDTKLSVGVSKFFSGMYVFGNDASRFVITTLILKGDGNLGISTLTLHG